jgi:hypothetical protein
MFKIPIIFMTATFNIDLLNYLQHIGGFVIPNPSIFWSDTLSFSCCNITIKISSAVLQMKIIKECLSHTLKDNLNKKAIVYLNVAKSVNVIRDNIDDWLNEYSTKIEGDTILINGDLESEWKFFSSQQFTEQIIEHRIIISNNVNYPCIIVATSGCIGAGPDSSEVYTVGRDVFP